MQAENNVLLKEWASVLNALAIGQQVFLFRKGGIVERNHQFEITSPEFFLFPTYVHQDPERLQPSYRHWVAETEAQRPGFQKVKLGLYAKATHIMRAQGVDQLVKHPEWFIWTPEHIETAWQWEPEKPAYIVFLRVYALENPYILIEKPEFGGCTSWIQLPDPLVVRDLVPVLEDSVFAERCAQMQAVLEDSLIPV